MVPAFGNVWQTSFAKMNCENYQGFFSCFITKNSKSFNFTYLLKPKLKQVVRNSFFPLRKFDFMKFDRNLGDSDT